MNRIKFVAALAAFLLATLILTSPIFAADAAKVAGQWNLTLQTANGPANPTATFKQDGETLTGTYKGRFGESPLKGTIKGNDITFSTTISPQGQEIQIVYSGTVDGDSMKGKVKFGDMGEGEFTGKKASETPAPK
jgi:hypothetical protein